jgi:putative heme-binding domain-containing protein
MPRASLVVLVLVIGTSPNVVRSVQRRPDDQARPVQWIWFDEKDASKGPPDGTHYFRKVFEVYRPVQKPVDEGTLNITAAHEFAVWINGAKVGEGSDSKKVFQFDVTRRLVHGKNVIAVAAKKTKEPAGLLVRMSYVPNGMSRVVQASDDSWKCSVIAGKGWEQVSFDDSKWQSAKVLGPYGKTDPWRGTVWGGGGSDRFTVPEGFRVEMAAQNPNPKDPFSLINLTFDDKGRLLVSQEGGPTLLCTKPDQNGVFQKVKPYCRQVRSSQGMCWVKDSLWLTGDGPNGTGMYRVRDTKGNDSTDEVKLIHKFPLVRVPGYGMQGGMGEHGPHAIVYGPDGWLYLVVGNHAWAKPEKLAANSPLTRWPRGQMGPDQGKPNTTEDILLPRLNDGRGHAANILAPGGTIWRFDQQGQNWSLVNCGFRNHFDAAFSPFAELFTFDSDMEWDEGLPWYRPVRICHCPPGADFVWRTGSANTPNYYIDSLTPICETGRGSPVGLEFYDHVKFPDKYRGAYFMGDWSLGIIWAVRLKRDGASYKATVEKFCQGAPMNVTDIAVGPDGALYFTMGGRGSQGGVYRIVYTGPEERKEVSSITYPDDQELARHFPQPLAAWSREQLRKELNNATPEKKEAFQRFLNWIAYNRSLSAATRVKALTQMQIVGLAPKPATLLGLMFDAEAKVRAHCVWLLGVNPCEEGQLALQSALKDADPLVRRRACEALIRAGIEPPVDSIWPLLADKDRFLRTAARLVLQRIDPSKWTNRLWTERNDVVAEEGIIALCKTNQAAPFAAQIFQRLETFSAASDPDALLRYLRTLQVVLVHTSDRPMSVRVMAERCCRLFPQGDWRGNRELAILVTYFAKEGLLDKPVHAMLLQALEKNANDRMQQIYYFSCLRFLHWGWNEEQKQAILSWYDSTKSWTGGHSFTPFLWNILRDLNPIFTADDRMQVVHDAERLPWATIAMLEMAPADQRPSLETLRSLYQRLAKAASAPKIGELKDSIIRIIGNQHGSAPLAALRKIADIDPGQCDAVVKILARSPSSADWPYLLKGLNSSQRLTVLDALRALQKLSVVPQAEDPAPYRAAILAAGHVDDSTRWKLVELLRRWTKGKQFGAEKDDWKSELTAWSRWYAQAFPKEPALPNITADKPQESKYKFDDLLSYLEKNAAGKNGTASRGRIVFEKAQCIKCHKYGQIGEGLGPDLTTVSKRFKRSDILESIIYPSKVISDQYRSSLILTKSGQRYDGLAAPQGDLVTILLSDGSKVTLKRDEIDQQYASLVSVMPERLLDTLTKEEIADLFSFLESEPK